MDKAKDISKNQKKIPLPYVKSTHQLPFRNKNLQEDHAT